MYGITVGIKKKIRSKTENARNFSARGECRYPLLESINIKIALTISNKQEEFPLP